MKTKIFMLLLLLTVAMPSMAVLKEKDLSHTLAILRQELTGYRIELERQTGYLKEQQDQMTMNMYSIINQCSQNSLMLYSLQRCIMRSRSRLFPLKTICSAPRAR